jgi:hypothetical protein
MVLRKLSKVTNYEAPHCVTFYKRLLRPSSVCYLRGLSALKHPHSVFFTFSERLNFLTV